ncbi:hypothetical protein VQ03_07625 [Methylobacterium tarhaniae]|uniref:Uncharacterized protein n=1 Tax=Methylobacterium tarhaniae TaxID=1187852 RepID=A0A0J6VWD9_9HYPH|nr:hypothetical protein [Methylobacterium tarhaniae]KMO43601.1 hypothetical protein VQ03_07625 [Methylobacterium tarhaniae]
MQETFAVLDALMAEPASDDVPAAPVPIVSDVMLPVAVNDEVSVVVPKVPRTTREQIRAWKDEVAKRLREQKERQWRRDDAIAHQRSERKKAETLARLPARKRRNSADYRERQKAVAAELLTDLNMPLPVVDQAQIARETAAFVVWLATDGPRQRQLRRENVDINDLMATRAVFLATRDLALKFPKLATRFEAATGRTWDRHQAKRRVALLAALESAGGPWTGDVA